jgi:N-acetylglucosaminyldiphosphoundecaprenol N-acetyl-beta-D-mannosaminyltransferase
MSHKFRSILGAHISCVSWDYAIEKIITWAQAHESRYVSICNVHSVVTTTLDSDFRSVINNADMATPDGAPVAWMLRRLENTSQERINGPDLMWRYLGQAEKIGQTVYFYGATDAVLKKLINVIDEQFPHVRVAGAYSPPFRAMTALEDQATVDVINRSGAHVVFVGLGCPKQEKWMAAHCGRINAVMIGVGAAFDYHSGILKRAPLWWQRNGLEWLYRLCMEPRRLFKRYLITNTLFILGISWQLLTERKMNK